MDMYMILIIITVILAAAAVILFGVDKRKYRLLIVLFGAAAALMAAFLVWTSDYYRAGETAKAAMRTDSMVTVEKVKNGWLFDGPSEENMLVFYPGAKVEETAYAPLLRKLAEEETDVFLVKMPLHLAVFGINAADDMIREGTYSHYYIGGHSLGGAMAAFYGAGHGDVIDGQILLAAYPTKKTAVDTALIYGSGDGVLRMPRVEKAKSLVSGLFQEYVITGGNHAQFGDYGVQAGDGKAQITASQQQSQTLEAIESFLGSCRGAA